MARIMETKKYLVDTNKGQFKIYVSRHSDGNFYAGVLWYEKTGSWSEGEEVQLKFDLESFVNTSEDLAFQEAENWVKNNLDPNAEISPEE